MPEQYNNWMLDPQMSQYLIGYKLSGFSPENQTLLEKAYNLRSANPSPQAGNAQIKSISKNVGVSQLSIKQALNAMLDRATSSNFSKQGQDPQVFEGGGHHNGDTPNWNPE